MSKERLEEIQKDVNYAYRRDGSINTKAITMHIEHYEHLYEQAERVPVLEFYKQDWMLVTEQNKRYREAIIQARKELNMEVAVVDPVTDANITLRQALEETE